MCVDVGACVRARMRVEGEINKPCIRKVALLGCSIVAFMCDFSVELLR